MTIQFKGRFCERVATGRAGCCVALAATEWGVEDITVCGTGCGRSGGVEM